MKQPATEPFVPFLQSLNGGSSASAARFEAAPAEARAEQRSAEPHRRQVEIRKEGDAIREIRIACSCGELIQIHCEY